LAGEPRIDQRFPKWARSLVARIVVDGRQWDQPHLLAVVKLVEQYIREFIDQTWELDRGPSFVGLNDCGCSSRVASAGDCVFSALRVLQGRSASLSHAQ